MRFYSGFSFRFRKKHLKWLLVPFIAIVAKFGLFGFINVYAYYNYSTYYNVSLPQITTMEDNIDSSHTYLDVMDNIRELSLSSNYYDVYIIFNLYSSSNNSTINLHLIPKGLSSFNVYNYAEKTSPKQYWLKSKLSSSVNDYETTLSYLSNGNIYESSNYLNFVSCLSNNTNCNNLISVSKSTLAFNLARDVSFSNSSVNNDDVNVDFSHTYQDLNNDILYYSSLPLYFAHGTSSSSIYLKSLKLNGVIYDVGDLVPTYYDIYPSSNIEPSSSFIGSSDRLNLLYSNFSTNDLSNFNINVKFDTNINNISAYNYYQNINFTNYNCYGRINHNDNYYTYEKFSTCTFELNTDFLDISSDNSLVDFSLYNLEIFDSNDIKITDFSNYDKLFFYISFQYDDDTLDLSVRNLEFNSILNLYYTEFMRGEIYDNFYELPIYSKLFFSNSGFSNNLSSNISAKTKYDFLNNSVFLYAQKYYLSTLETKDSNLFVASGSFQNLKVDSSNNVGYMIYNKTDTLNSPLAIINLDLILMRDIVISYNGISSNDFYYVDSNGDIVNNTIVIDYSNDLTFDLSDFGGLLPPGPLDSLLNIPFYYTNKVITSLNESCQPWTFNFVFDKPFTMPCFDTFYEEFPPSLVLFLEVIPSAFILIGYYKHLYKKVDRATSLNTSSDDEWGVL